MTGGGKKKPVCLFSQVQLLNIMLAMTLLASANNPRLQCYCVLEQSKHTERLHFCLSPWVGPRGVGLWSGRCVLPGEAGQEQPWKGQGRSPEDFGL